MDEYRDNSVLMTCLVDEFKLLLLRLKSQSSVLSLGLGSG
jgi:hypothetical protein